MMLNDRKKEIIMAIADCNMNLTEAARRTHFHRNNVLYHCLHIHSKTGLNPQNFYDLIKLVEMAKEGG